MDAASRPPQEPDTGRYLDVMWDIKHRLAEAHRIMNGETLSILQAEFVGLLLRRSIEMVVMSSLAANQNKVAEISKAFRTHKLKDAAKAVKNANPEYWPKPTARNGDLTGPVTQIGPISEPWLQESEWRREWSYLSEELLHAHNPFREKRLSPKEELSQIAERLQSITDRTRALMQTHLAVIAGGTTALLVRLDGDDDTIEIATLVRPQPLDEELTKRLTEHWGRGHPQREQSGQP